MTREQAIDEAVRRVLPFWWREIVNAAADSLRLQYELRKFRPYMEDTIRQQICREFNCITRERLTCPA